MSSLMALDEIRLKKPGNVNPVIVSFQNGTLNQRSLNNAKVKLKNTSNDNATTVEVVTPNGHVFVPSDNPGTLKRNLLLIRNRKTNKVKLVEVDYELLINSIFPEKKDNEVVVVPKPTGKETITLQKMFGGKRAVRRLDQMEKLNVNPNLNDSELKSALKDVDVSVTQLDESKLVDDSLQQILPPCNRDATSIAAVYDLVQLIGEEEIAAMIDEAQKTLKDDTYTKSCSNFFKDCLKNAKGLKSENLEQQVVGILYCELLIEFLKTNVRKLNSHFKLCTFSTTVHDKIVNDFCVKTESGVNRPISMRDKAICYIMAISIVCSNYKIDLKLLSEATSYNVKKLGQLAKCCGLTQTASNHLLLKLPLPALPKPPQKKLKKR